VTRSSVEARRCRPIRGSVRLSGGGVDLSTARFPTINARETGAGAYEVSSQEGRDSPKVSLTKGHLVEQGRSMPLHPVQAIPIEASGVSVQPAYEWLLAEPRNA
jgi:hypothetical protein